VQVHAPAEVDEEVDVEEMKTQKRKSRQMKTQELHLLNSVTAVPVEDY